MMTKESKYVCDCSQAHLGPAGLSMTGVSDVRFAGVYCEFRAMAYCQKGGGGYSDHAFCANGGECRLMVGRNEEHAGCKCPPYYEGHYCQFVRGTKPSDWEMTDLMNPALFSNGHYYGNSGRNLSMSPGGIAGMTILILVAIAIAAMWVFVDRDALGARASKLRGRFSRNDREIDTSDSATENPGGMISPQNSEFIGGKSVYNKRTTSGGFPFSFVATSDALDADGGVLMEAMDEVDLNDDASVKGKFA
ncbi:hypothetical protein ACHAXA_001758 [Cyclostephanos tholiformis]|uniref:EGF-like domain-containing protein n=1 Tax=Cyclostephanos tholiformis TaxID=382380 RepID=A0ABD3RYB9_9STRA